MLYYWTFQIASSRAAKLHGSRKGGRKPNMKSSTDPNCTATVWLVAVVGLFGLATTFAVLVPLIPCPAGCTGDRIQVTQFSYRETAPHGTVTEIVVAKGDSDPTVQTTTASYETVNGWLEIGPDWPVCIRCGGKGKVSALKKWMK